jgi:hypothetical protein
LPASEIATRRTRQLAGSWPYSSMPWVRASACAMGEYARAAERVPQATDAAATLVSTRVFQPDQPKRQDRVDGGR